MFHFVSDRTVCLPITLEKLLADVCPTQFGRDKIDCSHAKCRRCCFYFCDNFHFPTNKKEEKTIAAVIYYKKLNILSALINIYLNFKISTSSSQTIPFQFLYFLSRPNCVGQTFAKSFWSVRCQCPLPSTVHSTHCTVRSLYSTRGFWHRRVQRPARALTRHFATTGITAPTPAHRQSQPQHCHCLGGPFQSAQKLKFMILLASKMYFH